MTDVIILTIILVILGWTVFKSVKNFKSKKSFGCSSCKNCQMNDGCSKDKNQE